MRVKRREVVRVGSRVKWDGVGVGSKVNRENY